MAQPVRQTSEVTSKPALTRRTSAPAGPSRSHVRPRSRSLVGSSKGSQRPQSDAIERLGLELPSAGHRGQSQTLLASALLGSIQELESDLRALESETDGEKSETDGEVDSDSGDEQATLLPREEAPLAAFVSHARAYVNHIKAMELPEFSFSPSARLQEMGSAVYHAEPLKDVDIASVVEAISAKLQLCHERLTALVSATASTTTSPKLSTVLLPTPEASTSSAAAAASARPAPVRRYTLSRLYTSVPSLQSMPSPLPAIKAFLAHEAIRLSNRLPPSLLRRPSFSHLPEDFEEMMSRARHNLEGLAGEAKREFRELMDEAERMRLALQAGAKRLLRHDELPQGFEGNPHIHSGYRFIPISRWDALLLSLFQWHNESINVWSHALGAASLVYGVYAIHPYTPQALSERALDGQITLAFLCTAIACLSCSAIWHLFSGCGTLHVFNSCACLDYVGISSLITGSVVSLIHFGFYCEPQLALYYITFSLATGLAGVIFPWQAWFNEPRHKGSRIMFFLALCGSAVFPQMHMVFKYGLFETISFYTPAALSASAYICGLLFYANNIPERWRPGSIFDHVAHSHQFWHLAILAAIYTHWWATVQMFKQGTTGFSCAVR